MTVTITSMYDQLTAAERQSIAMVVGADVENHFFRMNMQEIAPIATPATMGDFMEAYLRHVLAKVEGRKQAAPAKQPRIVARINKPLTKHLYEVGTDKGTIEVEADTRSHARQYAKKAGYEVHDVNMVG